MSSPTANRSNSAPSRASRRRLPPFPSPRSVPAKALPLGLLATVLLLLVAAACSRGSQAIPADSATPFPDLPPRGSGKKTADYLPSTAEKLDRQLHQGVDLWAQNFEEQRGPLYGLYQGQVVSMTYLFTEEYLMEVPWFRDDPANPSVRLKQPMYELIAGLDMPIDHFDVAYTSAQSPGLAGPHWEVTAWRIPHQDHLAISRKETPVLQLLDFPLAPDALPKEAVESSDPVPGLGQHWWAPRAFPHGPFWVTICGDGARWEVVGVVYMYSLDDMAKTSEGVWEFNDIPLRITPNHVHVILAPAGFHGFAGPHWDLRVQFTSHEDHMTDPRFNPFAFIPCLEGE